MGGSAGSAMEEEEKQHGFGGYLRVFVQHRHFRMLWLAETIDNVGAWLNYVATLSLVEQMTGGSGMALSGVVLIRFLPSLVLAPVTGVLADRMNRVRILILAAVLGGAAAAGLAAVTEAKHVGPLYLLLFLQFTATAFYDPARKAMIPVVVPEADLHLATTIDSFAWSLTGAVGASLGGMVASQLGNAACFLIDAATYLLAAGCAMQVPQALGDPSAASKQLAKARSMVRRDGGGGAELELAEAVPAAAAAADAEVQAWPPGHPSAAAGQVHHRRHSAEMGEGSSHARPASVAASHRSGGGEDSGHGKWAAYHKESDAAEIQVLGHGSDAGSDAEVAEGGGSAGPGPRSAAVAAAGGGLAVAAAAWKEGLRAFWEGWSYLVHRDNRHVALIVTIKACGSLTWGAMDVMNVKFAEMPALQLRDTESTLGFLFGTVGFGCFVGPVLMNLVVAPRPGPLRWGVAAAFGLLVLGYLLMLVAPNIAVILVSTLVRSIGSSSLWVYSTLLLQFAVDNSILGRMSAVESALYTVAESTSSVLTGAAFDLGLGPRAILAAVSVPAAAIFAFWLLHAIRSSRGGKSGEATAEAWHSGAYLPVASTEPLG